MCLNPKLNVLKPKNERKCLNPKLINKTYVLKAKPERVCSNPKLNVFA